MKKYKSLLKYLISMLVGLVIAIIHFMAANFIVAALTYTIPIKHFEDADHLEQQLGNKINIDIKTVDKIDNFIVILGKRGEASELLVLGNHSFYLKDHYKKLIGNSFYSEEFSQQFFSDIHEYKLNYHNGNFSLEKKRLSLNDISIYIPITLIVWLMSAIRIKRKFFGDKSPVDGRSKMI